MAHLTQSDRIKIEHYLNSNYSLRKISKLLDVNVSTISREIQRNKKDIKANNYGLSVVCKHRRNCELLKNHSQTKWCSTYCENFEQETCKLFDKAHNTPVCNSCNKFSTCRLAKKTYKANTAIFKSENRMLEAKSKIRITQEQFDFLNNLFTSLMKKGQSISVIYNNHINEMMVSENTIRNYVRNGLFGVDMLDTIRPRFVVKTSKKRRIIRDSALLANRTFEDYQKYINSNDVMICQMDTVVGKLSDSKKILTIHWPTFHLQIGILLPSINPINVNTALHNLKDLLGTELYKKLFQVILTDNGIEFSMMDEVEIDNNGEVVSRVFFCDPYSSSQKGACERNHEFFRYIMPKGKSFECLNQKDVDLIFSHINSTPRKSLGFKSPYDVFESIFGTNVLDLLGITKIHHDEVILKRLLINK